MTGEEYFRVITQNNMFLASKEAKTQLDTLHNGRVF